MTFAPHRVACQRQMLLSVVVVNWNSRDDLDACLSSLTLQAYPGLEVIVVDNGSSDGSAEMVEAKYPNAVLCRESTNLGFAEACNRGIRVSRGDWVVMLNNDAVAQPGWAEALVQAIAVAPPDCGMLQSLMLYEDRPNIINSTGIELAYSGGGRDRHEGKTVTANSSEREAIFCPTAGAAAYKREMLETIRLRSGYFDRLHFMYYEDMDLGWRADLAGWTAQYVPDSIVYHRWHGSSRRKSRAWLVTLASTNRVRTLLKNASALFIVYTLPRTFKELGELAWHGGPKGLRGYGRALVDSLRSRREVTAMLRVSRRTIERRWRAGPQTGT